VYCFDVLDVQGRDLGDQPLVHRPACLQALLRRAKSNLLNFRDSFPDADALLTKCSRHGLVGKGQDLRVEGGEAHLGQQNVLQNQEDSLVPSFPHQQAHDGAEGTRGPNSQTVRRRVRRAVRMVEAPLISDAWRLSGH
jgi:hypothetical protein